MRRLSLAIATLCVLSGPAMATITGGDVTGGTAQTAGGTFVELTVPLANPFGPPNSVGSDTFQSPNLYGFDEDQNIFLTAPLVVDVGGSPIPAGSIVASHYVFFDPGPSEHVIATFRLRCRYPRHHHRHRHAGGKRLLPTPVSTT